VSRTVRVTVLPDTLAVTNICAGEHVITGGADGQVYIATFADGYEAARFVRWAKGHTASVGGDRVESGNGSKA
jgi:hypothetical protein